MIDPGELIANVVHAAVQAQQRLEGPLTTDYLLGLRPIDGTMYSFRTIALDSEFMLEQVSENKFLFFFRSAGISSRLVHNLRLQLRSEPSPPLPPRKFEADSQEVQIGIPAFMLTDSEDRAIRQAVKDALMSNRWTPRVAVSKQQVQEAANALLKDPTKGRGPVVFQLDADQSLFLVVLVSQKDDPDGLYVYSADTRSVTIFGVPSVHQDEIEYEPLHLFGMAVQRALFGPPPIRKEQLEDSIGIISGLDTLVDQLAEGYRGARKTLAAAGGTASVIPSYLDVGPLEAQIRYSASFNEKKETGHANIVQKGDAASSIGNLQDDMRAIVGTAKIAVNATSLGQKSEVIIGMPSFVLSGKNLVTFLGLAYERANDIANNFANDSFPVQIYVEAIQQRKDVVILQAFDQGKPNGNLLAIWPGVGDAMGRHFVFTCHVDSDATKLQNVNRILALGEDLTATRIKDGGDDDQYGPFHNVFHAILVWATTLRNT